MKAVSEVTACVSDKGLFLPLARRLARDFKRVFYTSPHEKAFRTVRDQVGHGFDDIVRVDSIWQVKKECDLFIFPDIGFSPEQQELIDQGYPVWGARRGDSLEDMRGKFLSALEKTTLPIPPHVAILGMDALRDHLKEAEDKYIKISKFRGDWETMHWRNWDRDRDELESRSIKLGPPREAITFYVFEPIDTEIEDGCDAYCIDGQWPETIIHGMESKDAAFLGTFQKFSELPHEVRTVNEEMGPILAEYGYRGLFSTEVRITKDGESYFIDPTCRAGSPPSQLMAEMISNLGEIVWHGAHGELVEPEQAYKFGVQGLLVAKGDKSTWASIDLPDELDQWIKCGFAQKTDSGICIPNDPDSPSGDIGWLVGIGDTIQEAIDHLRDNVDKLPDGVTCDYSKLADLLKEVDAAQDSGMKFTNQPVPEPATIIDG